MIGSRSSSSNLHRARRPSITAPNPKPWVTPPTEAAPQASNMRARLLRRILGPTSSSRRIPPRIIRHGRPRRRLRMLRSPAITLFLLPPICRISIHHKAWRTKATLLLTLRFRILRIRTIHPRLKLLPNMPMFRIQGPAISPDPIYRARLLLSYTKMPAFT